MLVIIFIIIQNLLVILALAIVFYIAYVMISFKYTIPYVPTPRKIIGEMARAADLSEGMKIVDIGSGTGRILFYIARRHKVQATGVEKFLWPYLVSKAKLIVPGKKGSLKFARADMYDYPLDDADRIFCYITPEGAQPLSPKLNKELKKGAKIISYFFPFKGLSEFDAREIKLNRDKKTEKIFVYTKR